MTDCRVCSEPVNRREENEEIGGRFTPLPHPPDLHRCCCWMCNPQLPVPGTGVFPVTEEEDLPD